MFSAALRHVECYSICLWRILSTGCLYFLPKKAVCGLEPGQGFRRLTELVFLLLAGHIRGSCIAGSYLPKCGQG